MKLTGDFFLALAVMAGVTYLIRMLPFVLIRKKITNRYLLSFLYYIPYAVLAAMTLPAVLYSTSSVASAVIGVICACFLAFWGKGLLIVAAASCGAVLITELLMPIFF